MTTRERASVVCHAHGRLLVVRLRDPLTLVEALYPPGGAIEPGESPADAARRETLEETGVRVAVDPASELALRYPFRWAGTDYDVTTHYFAATPADAFTLELPRVIDASYNLGASWEPLATALDGMPEVIARAVRRVSRGRP